MEVGEQHLTLAHAVVLGSDGLLDFEDEVSGPPDIVGCRQDVRARMDELLVGDGGPQPGSGLDEDLMAVATELEYAGRSDGHAVLVVLELAGYADLHGLLLRLRLRAACARRMAQIRRQRNRASRKFGMVRQ